VPDRDHRARCNASLTQCPDNLGHEVNRPRFVEVFLRDQMRLQEIPGEDFRCVLCNVMIRTSTLGHPGPREPEAATRQFGENHRTDHRAQARPQPVFAMCDKNRLQNHPV